MSAPNVLWVCTDQQRFDTLGCYGNEHVETPNVDRLANEGVRFEHAYCQSPVCTPSRASFLTGRYPRTTRCRQNGQTVPDDETLVTRRFAEAGYNCGLVGKLHLGPADPTSGKAIRHAEERIDDGYGVFHWSHSSHQNSPGNEYRADWLAERGVDLELTPYEGSDYVFTSVPAEYHQTTWCAEKAVNFIEQATEPYEPTDFEDPADEPWLLSVNVFDPHVPFDPPEAYLERYLDELDEIPLPDHEAGELADKPLFQRDPPGAADEDQFPFEAMSEGDHRLIRAAYYAMVDLIDDAVGRMLDALERTGQREDTLVVFMSDHGEMLGDHGLYLKGPFFYEEAVRMPLVLSWPDRIREGVTSDALVELADLAPTLLDAAGIDHHDGMQADSFWPLLTGERDADTHRDSVYCEYYHALERPGFYGPDADSGVDSEFHRWFETTDVKPRFHDELSRQENAVLPYATMVRTAEHKLVHCHSLETGELYDLEADPGEHDNRYGDPEYREIQLELFAKLSNRMAQTVDPLPQRRGRW
jgi:arylsulfatase A-like enzyme